MNASEALKRAIQQSGLSRSEVSVRTGRSRQYLTTILNRGGVPSPDIYADFADICGYDLVLRSRADDSEIVISPPERE